MAPPKNRLISLKEVAQRTGSSLSVLNYYVNLGLLPVADRQGNKRLFIEKEIFRHLQEIHQLRREGYPLRIIRRQLQGQTVP
ncbi:MAG: MerR family transcriptional regulator [Candidatus Omnitrophica bacterium]|nr:MerR family transcriptional regulator [Candidatus Omnitrophota bacterium]